MFSSENSITPLAAALKRLIRGSRLKQGEVAAALGISSPAITLWLQGRSIPTSVHLRALVQLLESADPEHARHAIAALMELMPRPLSQVAGEQRGAETLGQYYIRPLWESFQEGFGYMDLAEKERVLYIANDVCLHPENPDVELLWPGLSPLVAAEVRSILYGLSNATHDVQQLYSDEMRAQYFAIVRQQRDPRSAVHRGTEQQRLNSALERAVAAAAECNVGTYSQLLPAYLSSLRSPASASSDGWDRSSRILSVALQTRQAGGAGDKLLLRALREEIGSQQADENFRRSVLRAYDSVPAAPVQEALDLDRMYWTARARTEAKAADEELFTKYGSAWEILEGDLDGKVLPVVDGSVIRMNASPYAECVWQVLLRLVVGCTSTHTLELVPASWRGAGPMLHRGDIDVAMHNDSLAQNSEIDVVRGGPHPLFYYSGYEMVISRARVQRVLESVTAAEVKEVLLGMIDDDQITAEELPREDNFYDEGAKRDAIVALLGGAKVAVQQGTDLEVELDALWDRFRIPGKIPKYPDQLGRGILSVLTGEVDILFGGNNDVRYLRNHFPQRGGVVLHVPDSRWNKPDSKDAVGSPTRVFFFARRGESRGEASAQLLHALWPWVQRLWLALVHDAEPLNGEASEREAANLRSLAPETETVVRALMRFPEWKAAVRNYVVVEMNRLLSLDLEPKHGKRYGGFVRDFREVRSILAIHNSWLGEQLHFDAVAPSAAAGILQRSEHLL